MVGVQGCVDYSCRAEWLSYTRVRSLCSSSPSWFTAGHEPSPRAALGALVCLLCVQAPSCGLTLFLLRGHCGLLRFCAWCMVACASPPDEGRHPGCCRPPLWPGRHGRAPEARAAGCTGWGSALAVHSSPTPSPSMRTHGCVGSSPVPSGLRPLPSEVLVC